MSSDRTTSSKPVQALVTPAVHDHRTAAAAKPPAPEILDLEIDENDDFGSDPYNRTGAHCIIKLGDDI